MKKTTRIDMHIHTKGSDGFGTPEDIAVQAVVAGLDGICITDHHKTYTPEGLEVAAACRESGLMVFRGCEYSSGDGHLLVYGVDIEALQLGWYVPMQQVISEVNRRGGFCVPAHPFQGYQRYLGDKLMGLKGVRAYEAANGQVALRCPNWNRKAATVAKKMGKLTTGGSDAHVASRVGVTYTQFDGNITNEKEFLAALKRGTYRAVTSRKRVEQEQMAISVRHPYRAK